MTVAVRLARLASGRPCKPSRPALTPRLCACAHPSPTPPPRRCFSTSSRRETLGETISQRQSLPRFSIPSSHVELLEHPSHFYKRLLAILSSAQKRIFIASLYIGKTETELIDHLRDALDSKPALQVTILVDSLRSTREGEYEGTPTSSSCASLLASLQSQYPDRVHVRLYRAPGLPTWLESLVGKRFVEGWGLQHMKIYGRDDEVMISGANLSNDYFTNRRDRYLSIRDERFSQYMHSLLMIAARYSFSLDGQADGSGTGKHDHARFRLSWDEGSRLPMRVDSEQRGPVHWKAAMRAEVESLTRRWHEEEEVKRTETSEESIEVVPLLQMGPLRVCQETKSVPLVLQAADSPDARVDFTTGYFSINPLYAAQILDGKFSGNMITASPQANGFYGSKGISGHLPAAYTWLESFFWARLKARHREEDIVVREWLKPGWTYHAKGIWLYPPGCSRPTVSLLGSSNFGTRSASLDLECTLLLDASQSPKMQKRLEEEVVELAKDATDVVGDAMFQREERRVHWAVKLAAWCIKRML